MGDDVQDQAVLIMSSGLLEERAQDASDGVERDTELERDLLGFQSLA